MAARLNPLQTQRAKDAIQTTQLCKRLNAFAMSLPDAQTGRPVEMSPAQVKAAVALLKKTLPDLQSIEGGLDLTVQKHEEALDALDPEKIIPESAADAGGETPHQGIGFS